MFADAIERIGKKYSILTTDLLNRNISIHRHKVNRIIKRVKTIAMEITKSTKLMIPTNISHLLDLIDELENTLVYKKPGDMLQIKPEKFVNYNKKLRQFCVDVGKLSGLDEMFSKAEDEADRTADLAEIKERGYTLPYEDEKTASTESMNRQGGLSKGVNVSTHSLQRGSFLPKKKSLPDSAESNSLMRRINSAELSLAPLDTSSRSLASSVPKRSTSNLFYDEDVISPSKDIPRLSRQKDIQKKSLPKLPTTDLEAEAMQ